MYYKYILNYVYIKTTFLNLIILSIFYIIIINIYIYKTLKPAILIHHWDLQLYKIIGITS